jgi:hypothetical protein
MGDAFNVNPAGCHVGCHQNSILALLKSAYRVVTLVLASVAVNDRAPHAFPGQLFRQAFRAALCTGEYQ